MSPREVPALSDSIMIETMTETAAGNEDDDVAEQDRHAAPDLGDESMPAAFVDLYEQLAPSLEAWARLRVTGALLEYAEPGDIVQEVWWRALDAFDRFDPDRCGFRAWVFRIATNVLLEWNRKRRRKSRLEPENLVGRIRSLPARLARQATSVGRQAELRDSVLKLVEAVSGLGLEDRAVLLHCGLEGRTAAQVALLVASTEDAVEQRWRRLRRKLAALPIWKEFDPEGS